MKTKMHLINEGMVFGSVASIEGIIAWERLLLAKRQRGFNGFGH